MWNTFEAVVMNISYHILSGSLILFAILPLWGRSPFIQLNTSSEHLFVAQKIGCTFQCPILEMKRCGVVWESMGKLRWIVLLGRRFLRRVIDTCIPK